MASSDEEGEIMPDVVTDYEFVDKENRHVSFACLPIARTNDEVVDESNVKVFLAGFCDNSLLKLYKEVVAWKYELSYGKPEISVLCKGNLWMTLLKPKKLFEPVVRSILVTVHYLHYFKHNPAPGETVWSHLSKVFSSYEVAPSEVDCLDHAQLIKNAAESDKDLASFEGLLGTVPEQRTESNEIPKADFQTNPVNFIVDDTYEQDPFESDEFSEEEELFDTCCSLCDNGGDILCCEGRCMRSFHATVASGEGSCGSLGLSEAYVNALANFFCKNCQLQRHQCFICGKLGSSDKSSNPEVFPCVSAGCGRFYHPNCVATELLQRKFNQTEELEKQIAAGESFVCPAHKCLVCKEVEDRTVEDLQFAVCRHCPKSYHRKCLPRGVTFEDDIENGITQRAWADLLPKRILLYCLDHEIDPDLGTPLRNHIRFPGTSKENNCGTSNTLNRPRIVLKKRKLINAKGDEVVLRKTAKQSADIHPGFRTGQSSGLLGHISTPKSGAQMKTTFHKLTSASRDLAKISRVTYPTANVMGSKSSLDRHKLFPEKNKSFRVKPGSNVSGKRLITVTPAPILAKKKAPMGTDADTETKRRIAALMETVNASFDEDEFRKKQRVPLIYRRKHNAIDKNLTKGKVEVTVQAVRAALQKLDQGGSLADAKLVCSPEMLRQIPFWKNKLQVYLAPFLHGTRYSSYGRHFTKMEKLQEVVDRLHCYVQDGDMVVDFCCGANDFSRLMKEKLDSVGKKCLFKNFDLFRPKNDFNFEQKDWFTVQPNELPHGSKLIMGLNPPFGVNGSLAAEFIRHALLFQPKLIILIVPPVTPRLNSNSYKKKYELVWENGTLLAGEAFYLPGSIDVHEKQLSQWNKTPPPLYLWSRPDWSGKHLEIAKRHGHIPLPRQQPNLPPHPANYLIEDRQDCFRDFSHQFDVSNLLDGIPEQSSRQEVHEHQSNANFAVSNQSGYGMTDDRFSYMPNFYNPGIMNVPGHLGTYLTNAPLWEGENVASFYPVTGFEGLDVDMDISPIHPQRFSLP